METNSTKKKVIAFDNDSDYYVTSASVSFNEHDSKLINPYIRLTSTARSKNEYGLFNEVTATIYDEEFVYPTINNRNDIADRFKTTITIMKRVSGAFRSAVDVLDPTCNEYNHNYEISVELLDNSTLMILLNPSNDYFCEIRYENSQAITVFKIKDYYDLIRIYTSINNIYAWSIKRYHDYFVKNIDI